MGRANPAVAPDGAELDSAQLALDARRAADVASGEAEPFRALEAAVAALHDAPHGLLPSVFVLEHGRLWLVAQRGYAVVPDGIKVDTGITGRSVRLGRAQLVRDVHSDPDYFPALPCVASELALPLVVRGAIVGLLNLESERTLPEGSQRLFHALTSALAPLVAKLARTRSLDLPALARLFVHIGSIRDPDEIGALAAASLPRVLPVESSQVLLWGESGRVVQVASWRVDGADELPLSADEVSRLRAMVEPSVVCRLFGPEQAGGRPLVWLPLRANGEEIGAFVGAGGSAAPVDPAQLDTAALLAAHVAASLDAAVVLRRERESAVTDSLTGVLNRRGLEELLDGELAAAGERRAHLSLLVIDCDDLKEVNDRAGHAFGDALLREVAGVLTRSLPEGASAARLGGDEFVVLLPEADTELAAALGERVRDILAQGLTEAGFPLRVSAGVSTYPFDGARPSALLRAADQALYAAKNAGKDRIASYQDVLRAGRRQPSDSSTGRRGRRPTSDGSILREAVEAAEAIEAEETGEAVCSRLCKALVFVVGATGCLVSRVDGDYLVDVTSHALRDVALGRPAAYRIADFPLTAEVLETADARTVSFVDGDVDPAEAFVLRDLGMNALLMLPLRVHGTSWGLVELYEMRLRRFTEEDVAVARFLIGQAEKRLGAVAAEEPPLLRPPIYELPSEGTSRRGPRTR